MENLLSPAWGGLVSLILLVVYAVVVLTRRRRAQLRRELAALQGSAQSPTPAQVHAAQNTQRASDFLSAWTQRAYYLLSLLAGVLLLLLPAAPLTHQARSVAQFLLMGLSAVGALLLMSDWQGTSEDRDRAQRRQLLAAQEQLLAQRGLAVRDAASGVYTSAFWLEALALQLGRKLRRSLPVTCLMLELAGLGELRRTQGEQAAQTVLGMVGRSLAGHVRVYDLVCRAGPEQFCVALLRCPDEFRLAVSQRITRNLQQLALNGLNQRYHSHLALTLNGRTFAERRPAELLRAAQTFVAETAEVQ